MLAPYLNCSIASHVDQGNSSLELVTARLNGGLGIVTPLDDTDNVTCWADIKRVCPEPTLELHGQKGLGIFTGNKLQRWRSDAKVGSCS